MRYKVTVNTETQEVNRLMDLLHGASLVHPTLVHDEESKFSVKYIQRVDDGCIIETDNSYFLQRLCQHVKGRGGVVSVE
jgi:hypothetical protein